MRKKWLIIPAIFLLGACSNAERSFTRPFLLADETIDNVMIGDKFTVEEKTLTYNGESKVVKGQIILPDGSSKSGDSFVIEMPGIYTVKYRAFFGVHEESYCVYYHCHRTSGDFFISSNKDNQASFGEYSHPLDGNPIKGTKLNLDMKTVFTYEKVIDFSSFSFANSFIDFAIDTSKQSTSDIETFTVRLTDTENSNNYVDITITDSGPIDDDGRGCYLLAGSNSQFKTGYEGGKNGNLNIGKYGANVGMSFRNLPEKGEQVARLYFDYAEKELHVSPLINSTNKDIITDLDDKSIYGSSIWEGFTNGKARLSIFANSMLSNSATLIVTKIGNQDLSPLEFVDTNAPVINVDYNGQSSIDPPKASLNKPYRIFEAEITDNFDNNLSYDTYVTLNDGGINRDITVSNGTFTPTKVGVYTITYIAKDHSNNVATKTVEVSAINDPQTISVTLDSTTISQDIFSNVNLPTVDEVKTRISGGSGKASVVRTIFDTNNKPMEIEGDSFVPDTIGEYKVYYTATDYIGNKASALLTVNATDPGHPVFIDEFALPRVLIKGHDYKLPAYQGAEVINNQTVYLNSKVYINDLELTDDYSFTAGDNCHIKYELTGQSGSIIHSETIEVINVGNPIDLTKYFYGNDFNKEVNRSDVTLTSSSSNPTTLFATALAYDNPYIKFAVDKSTIHFAELLITFSDSTKLNNSLSFHIRFASDKAYISVGNSGEEFEFASSIEEDGECFAIDFLNSTRVLSDILRNEIAVIKTNDQGEPFSGFTSGVYLDISFMNNTSSSSIRVLTISNQLLGHYDMVQYTDFASPTIIFNKEFINKQEFGDNAYIPTVQVFDVLSNATVKVSARGPEPDYNPKITNKDATKNQTFKLDEYGDYLVTYTGTDEEGNDVKYPRMISVYDYIAPELTITGSLKSFYKLNASIKIPAYKVTDDLNDYTLDIFLILPDNQQRLLLVDHNGEVTSYLEKNNMIYNSSFKVNSTTFRAEQRGDYTLRYVAYDSDFNKVVKELHFTVK